MTSTISTSTNSTSTYTVQALTAQALTALALTALALTALARAGGRVLDLPVETTLCSSAARCRATLLHCAASLAKINIYMHSTFHTLLTGVNITLMCSHLNDLNEMYYYYAWLNVLEY